MDFKLINPKPMNRMTLKGFFTLCLGPLEIEGLSYHKKGDKSWVNFPSRPYTNKETGATEYAPIVRIPDDDRYWRFQEWAKIEAADLFRNATPPEREPEPKPVYTANGDDIPF